MRLTAAVRNDHSDVAAWGTMFLDLYTVDDRREIHEALEELCSPLDNMYFASAGVYIYWAPQTREVLYIGLARDLPERFTHHNGLTKYLPSACKWRQIQDYFRTEDLLGFSVVVQSPLSQPLTHRLRTSLGPGSPELEFYELLASEPEYEALRELEGRLLKSHLLRHERLPRWNSIGGSRKAAAAVGRADDTLDVLTASAIPLWRRAGRFAKLQRITSSLRWNRGFTAQGSKPWPLRRARWTWTSISLYWMRFVAWMRAPCDYASSPQRLTTWDVDVLTVGRRSRSPTTGGSPKPMAQIEPEADGDRIHDDRL
jgi:hypothetical protein